MFKKIQCALTRHDAGYEIRIHKSASHEMLTPIPTMSIPPKLV